DGCKWAPLSLTGLSSLPHIAPISLSHTRASPQGPHTTDVSLTHTHTHTHTCAHRHTHTTEEQHTLRQHDTTEEQYTLTHNSIQHTRGPILIHSLKTRSHTVHTQNMCS